MAIKTVYCCMIVVVVFLSDSLADSEVCLRWYVTKKNLFVECKVENHKHEISVATPFDQNIAICKKGETPLCTGSGIFTSDNNENYTMIKVRTDMIDVEGIWKCLHGSILRTVNVSFSDGMFMSADIALHGEVEEIRNRNRLKLTCSTCLTPVEKSVEFFVNEVFEDNVRQSGGHCYHKERLCNPEKCTCSLGGNNFTLLYVADYSYLNISCEMRFANEYTSMRSIHRATLFYDGKGINNSENHKYISISGADHTNNGDTNGNKSYINSEIIGLIIAVICLLIFVGTIVGKTCFTLHSRKKENRKSTDISGDGTEDQEPLNAVAYACRTCAVLTVHSLCDQCHELFCHSCSEAHSRNNQTHDLFQIESEINPPVRQKKCETCNKAEAFKVCFLCKHVYCKLCSCEHDTIFIKPLSRNWNTESHKFYEQCIFTVKSLGSFELTNLDEENEISICGISSLNDFVVLADRHNSKLIVFENDNIIFKSSLSGKEPRGISNLDGNNIALTMPYDKEILFYKINKAGAEHYQTIHLPKEHNGRCIGRPYKIAYDSNHLAVETGLDEDGLIVIIDCKTEVIKYTISNEENFGYFTGNTIRLALDWDRKNVFVSALSKKAVSCVDFEGKIIWSRAVISPRDVVTFGQERNQNLFVISKAIDTLYTIDCSSGRCERLFTGGKLRKPRFIAYNNNKKIIYINQENTILLYQLE